MHLRRLFVRNVRNLREVLLEPSPHLNILFGANGAGKTSLLESVYVLLVGRSFRHYRFKPLIADRADVAMVAGDLISEDGAARRIALKRRPEGRPEIKLDGTIVGSIAELALLAPVISFDASMDELVCGSPTRRRQYLDWGLFHVEHSFLESWRRAERALRQRNEALRSGKMAQICATWSREYARHGVQLDEYRKNYFDSLGPAADQVLLRLSADLGRQIAISYSRGWPDAKDLETLLLESMEKDARQGHTRLGPHRADLRITADGKPAAEVLSRGQLKLVGSALLFAQAELVAVRTGRRPILLMDDLPAELDVDHRLRTLQFACEVGSQLFVTCVQPSELDAGLLRDAAMFHVEHGAVQRGL